MIKLEITGDTVEQFYAEAMRSLSMFMQSHMTAQLTSSPPNTAPMAETPNKVEAEPPKRRGRPPNPSKSIEPAPIEPAPIEPETATTETPPVEPAAIVYTREDCRNAVRKLIADLTRRKHDMPSCVEHVKRLMAPFNVQQASEVPEDRRAEFIAAAEAYISGLVK